MFNVLKRDYVFTITEEHDPDFINYLQRKLRPHNALIATRRADAQRLDISLDDEEGDVVAGIAAYTCDGWLVIDLLWVDERLRGMGIGRRLLQMAEEMAVGRGCHTARANTAAETSFYQRMAYAPNGQVYHFPSGVPVFSLHKDLSRGQHDEATLTDRIIG